MEQVYRFYALYDKISRDNILAHAYAQCRSNKGTPGIDSQDFADIEAYGVERWLAELALALRQETYRPEPIRRVFIPMVIATMARQLGEDSTPGLEAYRDGQQRWRHAAIIRGTPSICQRPSPKAPFALSEILIPNGIFA